MKLNEITSSTEYVLTLKIDSKYVNVKDTITITMIIIKNKGNISYYDGSNVSIKFEDKESVKRAGEELKTYGKVNITPDPDEDFDNGDILV